MDEDATRFVNLELDLFCLAGDGATFEATSGDDRMRLNLPTATWVQWGRPVSVQITVDTEQDA